MIQFRSVVLVDSDKISSETGKNAGDLALGGASITTRGSEPFHAVTSRVIVVSDVTHLRVFFFFFQ